VTKGVSLPGFSADMQDSGGLRSRASAPLALALKNAHARDARVVFDEGPHTYTVDGAQVGTSVTGLLSEVDTDHFDAEKVSRAIVNKAVPDAKYSIKDDSGQVVRRMTQEEICAQWTRANVLGTDLHGAIELFLNGEDPGALGDNTREFAFFQQWLAEARAEGWEPYRTEWVIFDEDADLAGSIDCVMFNPTTDKYMIVDWKRCGTKGSGFHSAFGGRTFLPPVHPMAATTLNKWMLQVNVYREILEARYGITVGPMGMVVLQADENTGPVEFWHDRCEGAKALIDARRTRTRTEAVSEVPVPVPETSHLPVPVTHVHASPVKRVRAVPEPPGPVLPPGV